MGGYIDITGQKFGKLTVVKRTNDYISPKGHHSVAWVCLCDCGRTTIVRGLYLKNGRTKSCGCLRIENPNRRTHGCSKTRLYKIWKSMHDRCENKKSSSYKNYGARGVKVCAEWSSFENFMEWACLNGYSDILSIDRIDNDGNYEPANCRWTDNYTQANNTRHNHYLEYKGERKTLSQWSKEFGINYHKLKDRINKCGWSVERSLMLK